MHVEVVIPAYQPDERLSRYVADLKASGFTAITVVDDGGGPAYAALFDALEREGCRVLRHEVNRGKGAALKTAFRLLEADPDLDAVVTADCDPAYRRGRTAGGGGTQKGAGYAGAGSAPL